MRIPVLETPVVDSVQAECTWQTWLSALNAILLDPARNLLRRDRASIPSDRASNRRHSSVTVALNPQITVLGS